MTAAAARGAREPCVRGTCHARRVISRTCFARCNCHRSGSHCQRDSEISFVFAASGATSRRTVRGNEHVCCRLSFAFAHHDFASAQGTRDAASTQSVWFGSGQQEGRQSPHRPSSASRNSSATGERHGIPRTIPACEACSGTRRGAKVQRSGCCACPTRLTPGKQVAGTRRPRCRSQRAVHKDPRAMPSERRVHAAGQAPRTPTRIKGNTGRRLLHVCGLRPHENGAAWAEARVARGAASGLLLLRGDVAGRALQSSSCCEPAEQRVRRSVCRTAVRGGARTILAPRPS